MVSARNSVQIARQLCQHLGEPESSVVIANDFVDEDSVYVPVLKIVEAARYLEPMLPFLMDICGVDYLGRSPRFEIVYHFADPESRTRLRVKLRCDVDSQIPSTTQVYKTAEWFEREVFDMFGLRFTQHPDLRRILCHEDFVGHPLRKDYPADRRQSLMTPLDHSFAKDRERMMDQQEDHLSDQVWLNIGPAHPATHGTLRFMAVLEGEVIRKVGLEIGYLHRCFEKMAETHTYNQVIPYTDRLNYLSSPLNNNTWCRTIEKMCAIEVPPRAQVLRVILDEYSRIIDHFVCLVTQLLDLGALTNFWLGLRAREAVYELFEKLCGARLTVSLARIGGLGFDLPEGWVEQARAVLKVIGEVHNEIHCLASTNRIFTSRMVGITAISAKDAINWGWTGPCLRACGVPRDLRRDEPYGGYENFDFDIPIGEAGDCYDRYMVRMEEILQSMRIIEQGLANIPSGPITVDDPNISLPGKQDVYGNIEGLMNQFMKVIFDVRPPAGEIYHANEGANGELGFYVVSDGGSKPYRVKCRPPCFAIFQTFPELLEGHMIADAIAALGTINIVAGELDR